MFCPNCGTQLDNGVKFCGRCGTRLDGPESRIVKETIPVGSEKVSASRQQSPAEPTPDVQSQKTSEFIPAYREQPDNHLKSNKKNRLTALWICVGVGIAVAAVLLVFLFVIKPKLDSKKQVTAPSQAVREEPIVPDEQALSQEETGEITTEALIETTEDTSEDLSAYAVSMDSIDSVKATSVLYEAGYDYSPTNLIDDDKTTIWSEGVPGDGQGEGITFYFSSKQYITGIVIRNGFQKNNELYNKNGRVKKIKIIDGDGKEQKLRLADKKNQQIISLDKPVYSDQISIYIVSVYKGNAFDDTCISEVGFY